jgi:hypothetical protein
MAEDDLPWETMIRDGIDRTLRNRDFTGLNAWMFAAGIHEIPDIEQWTKDLLLTMPHEVQMFWNGECNCDGHLN